MSGAPDAKDCNGSWFFRVGRQDLIVKLVVSSEAHPPMHFARRGAIVAVEFFPDTMKMVLAQSLCLVEKRVDDFPRGGRVVVSLHICRNRA